jgi:IS605 OrfB family transposase
MKVSSQKSYSFYSTDLNLDKYRLLVEKAEKIRAFRNELSLQVCDDFVEAIELSKFSFLKSYNQQIEGLTGQDIQHAVTDVFKNYDNKRKAYIRSILFRIQKGKKVVRYKVNTKKNKKGDLRSSELIWKFTKLSKIITYLSRYFNDGLVAYIHQQIPKLSNSNKKDRDKKQFYLDVLEALDKYGCRITELALSRRGRLLTKLTEHPIHFESLSFHTITRASDPILQFNKNFNSKIGVFVNLGASKKDAKGVVSIPVSYSKRHHGSLKDYLNFGKTGQQQSAYTICFTGKNQVRIILSKQEEVEIPTDQKRLLGVDVNVKHNLFYCSSDFEFDYDRDLLDEYVKFLKKIDQVKANKDKHGQEKKIGNKHSRAMDKWGTRITDMLKRKCSELVHYAKSKQVDHLVLEDLGNFAKAYPKNEEFQGFKYSRLAKLLHLENIKNYTSSIGIKNGVQVSFIQPHYTSQQCVACGYISRGNRKTQETFVCLECKHVAPADHNSSINIGNRILIDVLRESLLSEKEGLFSPKLLKKERIKQVLEDCNLVKKSTNSFHLCLA